MILILNQEILSCLRIMKFKRNCIEKCRALGLIVGPKSSSSYPKFEDLTKRVSLKIPVGLEQNPLLHKAGGCSDKHPPTQQRCSYGCLTKHVGEGVSLTTAHHRIM